MPQNLGHRIQHQLSAATDPTRWVGMIGLPVAVGIAYFLAAQLSLALLTKPEGVAVFWPAAGVSAGVLIALGPRARLSVAAEAVLTAWLIEHYLGPSFNLGRLRSVLGLVAAALIGTAASGIGGALAFK